MNGHRDAQMIKEISGGVDGVTVPSQIGKDPKNGECQAHYQLRVDGRSFVENSWVLSTQT